MTQDSKSINSHIDEYLNYYCNLSAPGFAVLLKGQWGAGKTWYINRYQEQAKKTGKRFLYISLYGMSSSSEIDDWFLRLLHPFWSSKGMAITGKIVKGLLKGTLKIDLTGDGKDKGTWNIYIPDIDLPNRLKDIDKSILIFDDLERCKIEIGSLLGYINYFVEQQEMKVIIIANESTLLDSESNSSSVYKTIKEKLIGKTFDVIPDFQGALQDFISKLSNPEVKKFLLKNTELIQRVYEESEYENLRNLKQILLDFERLFNALSENAKLKTKLLQDLLKFLIAFSTEIRRGKLNPREIGSLLKSYISRASRRASSSVKQDSNSEQDSSQEPLERYKSLSLYSPFPDVAWWQTFFDKGVIDIESLEELLPYSEYFQDENTPNWLRLWQYYYLSDDEFDSLLKQVEAEYFNREFSKFRIVQQVTGLFLKLSDIGLYSKSKGEILQNAKAYVDWLRGNNQLIPDILAKDDISPIEYKFGQYRKGELQEQIEEFKEFCSYATEIQQEVNTEALPNFAKNLIDTMESDIWRFESAISLNSYKSYENDKQYHDVPILKHIDEYVFTEKILSMSFDAQRMVFWALEERYKFINEALLEEVDWLKTIRQMLLDEASRRKGKLSGYALKLLITERLNPIIKKLEDNSLPPHN